LLLGNPYPSALDADKFIDDNIGTIETSTTDPAIDGAVFLGTLLYQQPASNRNIKEYGSITNPEV
jgi:hypothetical protein